MPKEKAPEKETKLLSKKEEKQPSSLVMSGQRIMGGGGGNQVKTSMNNVRQFMEYRNIVSQQQ